MRFALDALGLLPAIDWLAIIVLFGAWAGYARFARKRADTRPSILAATNRVRMAWMRRTTTRENRVVDGIVVQNLSTSPSFFASTTILIIGGLLAVLGTTDKATEFVREIPFAARTSALVFDLKLAVLTAIFVYAFFRFTWSMRQYSFGALLVGAAPERDEPWTDADRDAFALRAGRVMGLAAETFNDGLRAYYMAFAAIAWFFSAWACLAATAFVVFVLYRREFHSEVLALLSE
ncbi:DUF599 domain-containing protein [Ideonella sp.]|uniref:DUF599 domain-containing protein n=1 Tax=Ideonella sp. TaxID=1929293 RepID=UPI002B4933EA|nr:DUF599 domain-containing protein [Ideonella sp.]HJV69695.1 DUF599 domain-containing protein [Ideonella sp.]HSN31184.1 DUF599 domain-containing protein [Ideonella sp.]